jgi:hypothetical protein
MSLVTFPFLIETGGLEPLTTFVVVEKCEFTAPKMIKLAVKTAQDFGSRHCARPFYPADF